MNCRAWNGTVRAVSWAVIIGSSTGTANATKGGSDAATRFAFGRISRSRDESRRVTSRSTSFRALVCIASFPRSRYAFVVSIP